MDYWYLVIFALLVILELFYFRIANRFNIIDRPNERSSHKSITLRGGGVIYPIAFLLFAMSKLMTNSTSEYNYLSFGIGLLAISVISFIDDVIGLSTKVRLVFHFVAVSLVLYFVQGFQLLPIWSIPLCYIFIIGLLNAYNFMDGINGISGSYSLVVFASLLYVNQYVINFIDADFIIYPILATMVFLLFNFRKKAKCFLGDVGSMAIGFWVVALLALLMLKTGELKWILFLTLYGLDSILTIIERLKLKENIFDAHRRHLYQLLANERGISHLVISAGYAIIQLVINMVVIYTDFPDWIVLLGLLIPMVLLYILIKFKIKKTKYFSQIL